MEAFEGRRGVIRTVCPKCVSGYGGRSDWSREMRRRPGGHWGCKQGEEREKEA